VAILAGVALILAGSLAPIRSSVLAPAEVAASVPSPVRAPFDGVVESVHVAPNAAVHRGDLLVTLDTTERRAKAEVAEKALEIARAEYQETTQQALADPRVKSRLAILQTKVAQAQLELDYDKTLLAQSSILATSDGVAVFDDAQQWSGRPVSQGERIMVVAAPQSDSIDIHVPVSDVVTFAGDADVEFFPNVAPDRPSHGKLSYAGYVSSPTMAGVLSYLFRAHLDDAPQGLRLGLKGTAKIYGPRRPFLLWALRRPLAVVRQWLPL
jgi:multidrug resistance efflux pump